MNTPAYLLSEDSCFVNSYPDGKAVPQKTTLYSLLVVGRCLNGVAIGEDSVTVGSSPNGFAGMVRQPPISFLGGLGGGDVCDAEFVCSVSFVGNECEMTTSSASSLPVAVATGWEGAMASEEVPPGPGRQSSDNITSSDDTRGPDDDDESEGAPFRNFPKTPAGVGSDGLMCDADRCMYDRHNDDILYDSGRQANFSFGADDLLSASARGVGPPSLRVVRKTKPGACVGADKLRRGHTAHWPWGSGRGGGGGKMVLGLGLG